MQHSHSEAVHHKVMPRRGKQLLHSEDAVALQKVCRADSEPAIVDSFVQNVTHNTDYSSIMLLFRLEMPLFSLAMYWAVKVSLKEKQRFRSVLFTLFDFFSLFLVLKSLSYHPLGSQAHKDNEKNK